MRRFDEMLVFSIVIVFLLCPFMGGRGGVERFIFYFLFFFWLGKEVREGGG